PAPDEHVVLDIGDDVGALVLYTPPEFRGREIEVSPVGDDAERVHTEVLERVVNGSTLLAAVYPRLRAGDYRIWIDQPGLRDRFTITGGAVTEADWRPYALVTVTASMTTRTRGAPSGPPVEVPSPAICWRTSRPPVTRANGV